MKRGVEVSIWRPVDGHVLGFFLLYPSAGHEV